MHCCTTLPRLKYIALCLQLNFSPFFFPTSAFSDILRFLLHKLWFVRETESFAESFGYVCSLMHLMLTFLDCVFRLVLNTNQVHIDNYRYLEYKLKILTCGPRILYITYGVKTKFVINYHLNFRSGCPLHRTYTVFSNADTSC